jgi:predicted nucleotidyltransferase
MDASPILAKVAKALKASQLEAILIGNGAAALQGAPVTTVDLDFFYRETKRNEEKLARFAQFIGAEVTRPYPQLSTLTRLILPDTSVYLDFMTVMAGVSSLPSLRSRASRVQMEGNELLVASLEDVIQSKKLAGRPKDLAVMYVLEAALARKKEKADAGAEA